MQLLWGPRLPRWPRPWASCGWVTRLQHAVHQAPCPGTFRLQLCRVGSVTLDVTAAALRQHLQAQLSCASGDLVRVWGSGPQGPSRGNLPGSGPFSRRPCETVGCMILETRLDGVIMKYVLTWTSHMTDALMRGLLYIAAEMTCGLVIKPISTICAVSKA